MNPRQYKPDLSVKYAPRVPQRLRKAVNRICQVCEMPEADVLRYSFEAAVLTAPQRLRRHESAMGDALDSMMTVRTSRAIHQCVEEIWRNNPNTIKADILRALLEVMLPVAEKHGMAYVMKLREDALKEL